MMRVAALYDIHGNLPALEAVLGDVPDDAVIVCGGDCAAGPFPSETLERLRAFGDRVRWIRGNADRELTPGERGLAPVEVIEWVRSRLTPEQIAFLHGLPEQLLVEVNGVGELLFCHATPRNDTEVFLEDTPVQLVSPMVAGVVAPVVVCGHTHMQFTRQVDSTWVVNAGSVGMAYEDEPGAYWLLLGPGIDHRRTAYDPASLAGAGFPGRIGADLPSRAEAKEFMASIAVGE